MRWINHGERPLYESPWVDLVLADVEIPGGERFDHHVVRAAPAAGVVVADPDHGVLLMWRHRFITDTWGWEIPAGRIEAGETPEAGGRREALEETGWEPGPLRPLVRFHPLNGLADIAFHIFVANGASHVGDPSDPTEADRVEWLRVEELRAAIVAGEVPDGLSLTALCYWLAFG
jgi:8-oxo-dGTP pyrophosphatase MutT (NUDIX family)